jgi:hypothetical protein
MVKGKSFQVSGKMKGDRMFNKVSKLFAVAAMVSLVCVPAMAQKPEAAAGRTGDIPQAGPGVLLYDQTDNAAGNGAPDQDFEAGFDAYDAEGADDFVVAAPGWGIDRVVTVGTYSTTGPCVNMDVVFYPDAGTLPGAAPVCSYLNVVPTSDTAGSLTLDLPSTCSLPPGTYWVALQCQLDFGVGGQHFWSNRSTQSNSGSVWRNPNDGFATGCVNWDRQTTCGVGGGLSPDFLFQIWGAALPVELQSFDVD